MNIFAAIECIIMEFYSQTKMTMCHIVAALKCLKQDFFFVFMLISVQWGGRGEDKKSGGNFLQQPAVCTGAHQDQEKERPEVQPVHAGQDKTLTAG